MPYKPPYQLNSIIVSLVEEIGEALGRISVSQGATVAPHLRRGNRIQTIQASLAIEGNTLNLDQVTALLEGKRVLGSPREVQEVRNALAAYDQMPNWSPHSQSDLLSAHELLMAGLVESAGRFRSGGVGIQRGEDVVHIAPPAERVPYLVDELLDWAASTSEHPLVSSSVFHYELEFIHPFQDGNGRMGRLWQTLILSRWRSVFAYIPVESVVRDRQPAYYAALTAADQDASAVPFLEFMLKAILEAVREVSIQAQIDPVADPVTDPVRRLLPALAQGARSASDLRSELGLSHRPTFRQNYLQPALLAGLIELTRPDTPNARNQKYRLTPRGNLLLKKLL